MKKNISLNSLFNLLMVISIIGICVLAGIKRIYLSDFVPINGDFQTYNGLRRLLDGQIPFKDFYFYLGLGPLYLNSFFLLLFGNNFTNSLFVTNFITALMFSIAILVVLMLNRVKNSNALIITFIITALGLGIKDPHNFYVFFERINFLYYVFPGVSLRMQRAFLPFFIALLFLLLDKRIKWLDNEIIRVGLLGLLSGSCLLWSNDYGISVCLAISYIFFLTKFHLNLTFMKQFLIYILGAFLGAVFLVLLFTWGNLYNWIDYNFFGVAKDQFWYYERNATSKFLVLTDLPINFEIVCGILMSLFLSYKVRKGKATKKEILLLLVMLSTLLAGYAYAIGSLKEGQFIPFYLIFYISVFSIILNYIKSIHFINKKLAVFIKIFIPIMVLFFLVPKISISINQLHENRGVYVKELGGNLSQYGESLQLVAKYFVSDGELFSTYSSALDVMSDKFQPSGIDYLIHVLGDQYREKYLKSFHENRPRYVTTIREDYTQWEYWVKRENWFFYREFLKNYKPIAVTEYNILWEKTNKDMLVKATVEDLKVTQVSENTVEIYVKTNPKITNAVADVTINYSSHWNKKRWKGLGVRKIVNVSDGWNIEGQGNYNIPEEHSNYAIPIRIIDGEGVVQITSYPTDLTNIAVEYANINNFYIDKINYDIVKENMLTDVRLKNAYDKDIVTISDFTDANWEKGVNRGNPSIILFENNLNNHLSLKHTKFIDINGLIYSIEKIEFKDSNWIHVYLDKSLMDKVEYFQLM
ncbi:hypothetical protein EHV15_03995 [Paenibacillus oralis]|uniref:Uncharacterized protein n=1 Tax=Paenibacillus oralis TaxID=2490856 RepID=A0A3P3TVT3_9BACL|nr:hypothetical protein [Paenibacillus oralis]RRJ62202.1 hypothetical protein EHV15_03995 [Paenibacillus oralis]